MDKHANNDLEPVRRMRCAAAVALIAFSACAAEWTVVDALDEGWRADEAVESAAAALKAVPHETKAILVGLPPRGGADAPALSAENSRRREANARLAKLADGKRVFFLDISDRLRLNNGDADPSMVASDGSLTPKALDFRRRELERIKGGVQLNAPPDQRWRNLPWDDVPVLIYVSPRGDDAATGAKDAPLRTLAGARDRLRSVRAAQGGRLPGGAIVTFLSGEYAFDGTVKFTEEDSGSPSGPVIYRAERPLAAVFSGATRLDWRPSSVEGVLEAELPGTEPLPGFFASGCCSRDSSFYNEHPVQLYQDGRRLVCARWPNGEFAQIRECYADAVDLGGDTTRTERFRSGMVSIADADGNVKDLSALARERDVWAWGLWFTQYADATAKMTEFDLARNAFRFDTRLVKHGWRRKAECDVFNELSELDAEGEWVIDREARRLWVRPLAGAAAPPVASIAPTLVAAEGLRDVVFDGFVLEYARGAAVALTDCRGVAVRTCEIRHTAGEGVVVAGGADCRVEGCDMHDLGTGGVRMSGGSLYTLGECRHVVDNCHIHHYGQVVYNYQPGVAMYGTGCRATHNLIHHSRHQAIQFKGSLHYIGFNVMHDLCMHNGDAGAIYSYNTTGAWNMRGSVVEYNAIHMVGDTPRAHMCEGIYLDAFVSGTVVRGNLVNRATIGIFSSGGQDNLIERNVIMRCGQSIRKWNLGSGHHPCSRLGADSYIYYPVSFHREIFEMGFWRDRWPNMLKPLEMPDPVAAQRSYFVSVLSNALVSTGRILFVDKGSYFDDSETGELCRVAGNESFEGDPGFVDYKGGDWELRGDSPARRVLGGGTRFGEMGLYDSPLRASPAVKWGADMSPIRRLKREYPAAQAWIELYWKGDLPAGVDGCMTERDGCEYLPWGDKGKVILAAYGRVPHDRWRTYRFSFVPSADGEMSFELAGAWGEKTRYADLRVEGCAFANGDFSSAGGWSVPPPRKDQGTYEREPFDDAATFCDAAEPYGVVDGCGVANQFRRLVQTIHVRKGVRVSVTFRARGFDNPEEDY